MSSISVRTLYLYTSSQPKSLQLFVRNKHGKEEVLYPCFWEVEYKEDMVGGFARNGEMVWAVF